MSRFWQVVYALAPYFYKCRDFVLRWVKVIGVKTLCLMAFGVLVLIFLIRGAMAVEAAMGSDGSALFRLSPQEAQQCLDEGGCTFLTYERYKQDVAEGVKRIVESSAKGQCI